MKKVNYRKLACIILSKLDDATKNALLLQIAAKTPSAIVKAAKSMDSAAVDSIFTAASVRQSDQDFQERFVRACATLGYGKIGTIRVIRQQFGLGLKEAKELSESFPDISYGAHNIHVDNDGGALRRVLVHLAEN